MEKKWILWCAVILIGSLWLGERVPSVVAQNQVNTQVGTTCYLPWISDGCNSTVGEFASPFSLQIAAEHQLRAADIGTPEEIERDNAAALARIEAAYPLLTDALRDSGAGWTRINVRWERIQPTAPQAGQPPVYSWTYYDEKLRLIAGTGVQTILTVAYVPQWASIVSDPSYSCKPIQSEKLTDFANFLKALVAHYRVAPYNVTHWELFNEPDGMVDDGYLGGLGCWGKYPNEYAQMLSVARAAIKEVDAGAVVMMGGIAQDNFYGTRGPNYGESLNNRFNRDFPDQVIAAGGLNHMDTFTLHYFPDFRNEWTRWTVGNQPRCNDIFNGPGPSYAVTGADVMAKITFWRNRLQTCYGSDKPIWLTELAEHGYEGNARSLEDQARYVIKGHVRALASGVKNITWYALTTVNDSYEQGLLYEDTWEPKPSFTAYKTMTQQLRGYRYDRMYTVLSGEGYVFKNSCNSEMIVAWGNNGRISLAANQVQVVDETGALRLIQDGAAGDIDNVRNGQIAIGLPDPYVANSPVDAGDPGTPYFIKVVIP